EAETVDRCGDGGAAGLAREEEDGECRQGGEERIQVQETAEAGLHRSRTMDHRDPTLSARGRTAAGDVGGSRQGAPASAFRPCEPAPRRSAARVARYWPARAPAPPPCGRGWRSPPGRGPGRL